MYIALKSLRVMDGPGKVKTLKVGEQVDTTGWSARVMRAHLSRRLIEFVGSEDQKKIEVLSATPKKRGRKKKTEATESTAS